MRFCLERGPQEGALLGRGMWGGGWLGLTPNAAASST